MARPPNLEAPMRLLEAARDEFALHGVESARVEDIARRAGFSKAAFYLYWESKEQVFEALIADLFGAFEQARQARDADMARFPCAAGAPCPPEVLAQMYATQVEHTEKMLRVMWEKRGLLTFVLDEATGPRRKVVESFVEMSRTALAAKLGEAARAGLLRDDVDLDLTSDMIHGIFLQLGRRMTRLTEPPDLHRWALGVEAFIDVGLGRRMELT